jgi:hypothetical protein
MRISVRVRIKKGSVIQMTATESELEKPMSSDKHTSDDLECGECGTDKHLDPIPHYDVRNGKPAVVHTCNGCNGEVVETQPE